MDRIEQLAGVSVSRGCAFGALAIGTVMLGLSPMPFMAAKAGALMTTFMAVVLLIRAMRAPRRNYRRTEVWVMLKGQHELPEAYAQRVISGVLADTYLRHADLAAVVALGLWLVSFLAWLSA